MHSPVEIGRSGEDGAEKIQFRPYTEEMEGSVREFNARLHAGGELQFRFPENHNPPFPKLADRDLYQESFLLVQHGGVRGAYMLKHQKFAIRGTIQQIACGPQLPISEGIVDPRYGLNGVLLLRHALLQQPLLFAVGIGGMEEALAKLLRAVGWTVYPVSFYFKIIHPNEFLQNIRYLRRGPAQCFMLDLLRHTGIGATGVSLLQLRFEKDDSSVQADSVAEFGAWADALWGECSNKYSFIAVRDSRTLGILYPPTDPRFLRLRVSRDGKTIGWAMLMDTQMSEHKYFGNMRVGSLVDCLSLPEDSLAVTRAGTHFLQERGVTVIVSNQASSSWCSALAGSGFLKGPSNYILAMSKKLVEKLQPIELFRRDIHINRGDGDGPINL
jgi:hypothetical protein